MIGLTKAELTKLADKYRTKADAAYYNYQETGTARYDRERRNAEDMAEALQAAANAAEEHNALQSLRAEFVWQAQQADYALAMGADRETLAAILRNIISFAVLSCDYQRREETE